MSSNVMKRLGIAVQYAAVLLCLSVQLNAALPEVPQDAQAAEIWKSKREVTIRQIETEPKPEAIAGLGEMVRQLKTLGYRECAERDYITSLAQSALVAIPGHAEYFRDKIYQSRERVKAIGGTSLYEYHNELMYGFQTFPHLASPEGVRVLGEMLSDEWVPPGNETAPASEKLAPLSVSARVALQKFPLLDKPFKEAVTRHNVADANAAWLDWYKQIKSGKRTFRFEGDPVDYDLNGPAPKQTLDRITRGMKRDAERVSGRNKPETPSAAAAVPADEASTYVTAVATIVAGLGLLGSLAGYFIFWKRRRA